MSFTFSPGLDLTLICFPFPKFQLAYSGTAHLSQGTMEVGGRRAIDADVALSFLGDTKTALPSGVEFTTRADFAALSRVPALARERHSPTWYDGCTIERRHCWRVSFGTVEPDRGRACRGWNSMVSGARDFR
jgi:hypothetical protein